MTQVYLRGHGFSFPLAAGAIDCEVACRDVLVVVVVVAGAAFRAKLFFSSPSFLSLDVEVEGVPVTALAKLKAEPGVLGVFVADPVGAGPNEAKAPEPRLKALEPPVVGDDMPLVVNGVTALKGLLRPWEDVLPNRFVDGWLSLRSDLSMERESFPTLIGGVVSFAIAYRAGGFTLCDGTKGCLCPCPLRRLLARSCASRRGSWRRREWLARQAGQGRTAGWAQVSDVSKASWRKL